MSVRRKCALEQFSDFPDTCFWPASMCIWTGRQYTTEGVSEKYQIYGREFPALITSIVPCCPLVHSTTLALPQKGKDEREKQLADCDMLMFHK
jgi:hypothetical protein